MNYMPDRPAAVSAVDTSSGGRGHGPSNGVDEHDDGLSRVRKFSLEHFDREDHVVPVYQRSFAQSYDNLGHLALGVYNRNCGIGRIVCKTGRSQKKMMFGFVSFSVSRLPSKVIAFASWTNSMSQVSSSAEAGEINITNRSTMTNIDFISLTSKFDISRFICSEIVFSVRVAVTFITSGKAA
jgi:hypothetical protein